MLDLIRNNVQSFFVKFIVIIIAVVMLFFGIDVFQQQGANVLVEVGELEVTLEEYQRSLYQNEERVRQRFGAKASIVMNQMDLEHQTIDRLINDALLVQSAKANGIIVTDLEVADNIRTSSYFQTDGRFDQSKYADLLKQNNTNSKAYERNLRKELVSTKFIQLVVKGHSISRKFIEDLFIRNQTSFSTETLALDSSQFSQDVTPTDKQIKQFYDDNLSRFEKAKQYQLTFFILDAKDERRKIKVRDREIQKTYNKNKANYQVKTQWDSRHILIPVPQDGDEQKTSEARALARKLSLQLQKTPNNFAKLAKKHSKDPGSTTQGGNIGWMEQGKLAPAYEGALEELKVGEVSDPIFTSFGFHIIQLLGKKEGKSRSLEDAKSQIVAEITEKKLQRRLKNKAANIEKNLSTQTLAEVAKKAGQTTATTADFGPTSPIEKIGFSFEIYQALEGKQEKEKGIWTQKSSNRIIVYEVAKLTPASPKAFESVKAEAARGASFKLKREQALTKMEQAANKVQNQRDLSQLAAQLDAKTFTSNFSYEDRKIEGIYNAKDFVLAANRLTVGQAVAIPQGSSTFVTVLTAKTPGKGLKQAEVVKLEQRIKEQKAQVILLGMINDFKKTVDIKYNKKLASAVNLQL